MADVAIIRALYWSWHFMHSAMAVDLLMPDDVALGYRTVTDGASDVRGRRLVAAIHRPAEMLAQRPSVSGSILAEVPRNCLLVVSGFIRGSDKPAGSYNRPMIYH